MTATEPDDSQPASQAILEYIRAVDSLDLLMPLLDDIKNVRDTVGRTEFWEFCSEFFFAVKTLLDPVSDSVDVQKAIVLQLVLLSLESIGDDGSESSEQRRDSRYIQFELRRLLKDVLRQIEILERWALIERLEDDLCGRLRDNPSGSVFATISTIGMRSDVIAETLLQIARSTEAFAEDAICTLVDLGVPRSTDKDEADLRGELFSLGSRHLGNNRLKAVRHIVWYLCGPDGMELAVEALKTVDGQDDRDMNVDLMFSAMAHAIDRCEADSTLHREVWGIFRRNRRTINMNASFAFGCQTPIPVRDYLDWLSDKADQRRRDVHFSVTKSRVAELFKPQHLDGFDLVDVHRIAPLLKEVAGKDSQITGRFVTPSLDAKRAAVEWMQCLGVDVVSELNVQVALDETNPYAAHGIAELLSASPQSNFPEALCKQIETAEVRDQDDNENTFRQLAAIQLAHASETRDAFLAMTKFGFLHREKVLLSVINALTDLSNARNSAGDIDVFDRLLSMISSDAKQHHREAAVASLCGLVSSMAVSPQVANHLWEIADDPTLDFYSRSSAFILLGSQNVTADEQQMQWLREKAFSENFEHQRDAFEGLLQRKGISVNDYPEAAKFLGANYNDEQFQVDKPNELTDWQAYMFAHLYRRDPHCTHEAIAAILDSASVEAVHQVTCAVEERGSKQPMTVIERLRDRVVAANTRGRADTELIRVLSKVSPDAIIDIVSDGAWSDWLEPARVALADSLASCDVLETTNEQEYRPLFAALIRDPSLQVRRTAYRRFARTNPNEFALYLEMLSASAEPALLCRASEGIRWLPSAQFDDDFIRRVDLDSHPLPEVREIARDAIIERRNRDWCDEYIHEIEEAATGNRLEGREFRLGLAIKAIGDDETLQRLDALSSEVSIKPRIRFWLKGLRKAVKKRWKKTLGKQAEPWALLRGSVQMLGGTIYLPEADKEITATVHLWKHERKSLAERYSWGGILEPLEGSISDLHGLEEVELRLPSREPCTIHVSDSTWSSSQNVRLAFSSNNPWPEERRS